MQSSDPVVALLASLLYSATLVPIASLTIDQQAKSKETH